MELHAQDSVSSSLGYNKKQCDAALASLYSFFCKGYRNEIRAIFCIIFLLLSLPAFGELSPADLEKINAMFKASEARTKEYVTQEIAKVNIRIDKMDRRLTNEMRAIEKRFDARFDDLNKHLNDRFETVNKRLDNQFLLLLALVGFIGVVIGIPQILVALQRKNQRVQDEKIEAQQEQIEMLIKEIETLKQH